MLLVQDYLRDGGTLESLYGDHAVVSKPHNGKVSFLYDQLAAKDDNPLACQCRGLILREGSWDIVAYPFDRFFNYGQGAAAKLDWATARFEEKLDGTLLIVYFDDRAGQWRCATRQMCEAQGRINTDNVSFAELADRAARECGVGAPSLHFLMDGVGADPTRTYMFELTGPQNRIVCEYKQLGLTLLGIRSIETFQELDPVIEGLIFDTPKTWHFDNLDHMTEVLKEWDPRHYEGVVCKDAEFRRVKVKSPKYLVAHHAKDSLGASWRSVTEAVIRGAADDLEGVIPDFIQDRVDTVRGALAELCADTERGFSEIKHIDAMKEYAFAAQQRTWPAALFALKREKASSAAEYMRGCLVDHVYGLLQARKPELFT